MKKQELLIVLAVLMCMAMTALAIQQRARFPLINRMVAAVVGPVNGTMLCCTTVLSTWKKITGPRPAFRQRILP